MDKHKNPATIEASAAKLRSLFGDAPEVAVVLGSGWAGAVSHIEGAQSLAYTELPAFPQPKVEGHVNEVVVGKIGAQRVVMLRGRAHTYESGDCTGMAGALRSLKAWGVKVLVQTNASGSLRTQMPAGSLMLIADHINAPQRSPLIGEPGSERFVDMSTAYDAELRAHAKKVAQANNLMLGEGVYVWALGPQFETPAEIRMFAAWGADAVGMSTVPETILARHAGLRVMGIALMTNMAAGLSAEALTHALTLQQAQLSGERAAAFLAQVIAGLAELPLAARLMDAALLQQAARQALACLDLTSLNDGDTPADIESLCARAQTAYGPVAAVCVWPRFVAQARALLPAAIKVAAVADFPDGTLDLPRALADVRQIVEAGGDEVDVVLPYRALMAGKAAEVAEFLAEVRHASRPLMLKVIIESGELKSAEAIAEASRLALMAGADFVKTSTGKSPVSATPEAAAVMLQEIAASGLSHAGFKASGGIRTVAEAQVYLALAEAKLGAAALTPQRFRFGASGLLNDILATLSGQASTPASSGY